MALAPDPAPLPDLELTALAAGNTDFYLWCDYSGGRVRYIARRKRPETPGLYCVVTRDFAELRDLLAGASDG